MDDEDLLIEEDEAPVADDPKEIQKLSELLEKRCKAAGITIKRETSSYNGEAFSRVSLPSGRESRVYFVSHTKDRLDEFLSINFENYIFISGFEAFLDKKNKVIEAEFRSTGVSSPFFVRRRLFGSEDQEVAPISIKPENDDWPDIQLGLSSDNFDDFVRGPRSKRLTMRISNVSVSQHDSAKELLIKMANAVFFQIDLLRGIPLFLVRDRNSTRPRRWKPSPDTEERFRYPSFEYDKAPMSLYWYAKSAAGMPLLRFLAYYQAVEFYFPTYYRAEANRRIRSVLKDPSFRSDRDTDLAKIIGALQSGRPGGGGDERSQLRATINECVTAEGLRQFITEDEGRSTFLSSKTKGLTEHKLPIANKDADLRNDVADRIYDIRCKIVHTKGDGSDFELLLPFSREADQLHHDIDLLEYVTKQVLVAASTQISLPADAE